MSDLVGAGREGGVDDGHLRGMDRHFGRKAVPSCGLRLLAQPRLVAHGRRLGSHAAEQHPDPVGEIGPDEPHVACNTGSAPNSHFMTKAAPLHDIGKVGIPDRILLKPGKLTAEEFEVMKTHTTLGHEALVTAEHSLGTELAFLRYAKEITLSHQEKWDGSGYPQGLAGEAIPLSARLMAVADVYDALINRRIYKPPYTHEQAVAIIGEGSGTHFDPALVDAFMAVRDRFLDIAQRFVDPA